MYIDESRVSLYGARGGEGCEFSILGRNEVLSVKFDNLVVVVAGDEDEGAEMIEKLG